MSGYLTGSNFVYMGVVGEGSLLSHFPFGLEIGIGIGIYSLSKYIAALMA